MIKEKQKLPSWFNGELYEEGDTVTNRLSGEEYELKRVSPPVVGNVSVNINGQRYKVI